MNVIRVTYTTKAEYAEQNQNNIKAVMADLQQINPSGIFYHACLGADGKTFTHTAFYKSEDDRKVLNELPSFRHFQEQLKASGPETPPQQELLSIVGWSKEIL